MPAALAPSVESIPRELPAVTPDALSDAALSDPTTLAREIPGFGGLFLDARGRPTVYMRDIRLRTVAQRALAAFARAQGLAPADVQVLPGAYELPRLQRWFDDATRIVLASDDAVSVDLDESMNRLDVRVATTGAQHTAEAQLARLGIPGDAFVVHIAPRQELFVTLRDRIRPTVGGIQIQGLATGVGECTLGFNVQREGERDFITNAHCTKTMGVVDGTFFDQPTIANANSVGREIADPALFMGGVCPIGRRCRRSDAALVKYRDEVASRLGRIARPTGVNDGSITINFLDPYFTITSTSPETTFVVGTVLNKVGRSTGWTQGRVSATCVNSNVRNTNITLLCQTDVDARAGAGDSGSPVFAVTGFAAGEVRLVGILWGGSSEPNAGNQHFTFSPLALVRRELGFAAAF